MNIFWRELKARRKSIVFWSIGMFFMVWAGMQKFAGFEKSGQAAEVFKAFPKGVAAAFGLSNIDVNTALGWFAMLFMYLVVLAAIHASLLGAGVLAEEEQDKTAEFLYAKPISRTRAITGKFLAALILVFLLNIVTLLSSIAMVGVFNKGPSINKEILLMMIGMFVIQLIFVSIGMAAAAIVRKPKYAAPAASAIMFATFFLSLWLDITDKLPNLKYLTPFKYFDAKVIAKEAALDPVFIAISFVIIGVMVALTYVFYEKRDLSI
jgi:ABC-2 type transport system permease protein